MARIAALIILVPAVSMLAAEQPRGRYVCAFKDPKVGQLLAACLPYVSKEESADPSSRRCFIAGRTLDEWRALPARHIAALQ